MGKRFAIVIGVAAAGVMAFGAQTAAAAPEAVKYDTELTVTKDRGANYHGWVNSEVRKCMERRRVIVFKRRHGADQKLGTVRTNWEGNWWLYLDRRQDDNQRVYAKVTRRERDRFVCRADRSAFHL